MKRLLGRSGIEVGAVGMGCWAIGGPWTFLGGPGGWGEVDDRESMRAIAAALDGGANLFDTAANYGAGRSERVLGAALAGRRHRAVIATKFGYRVDERKGAVSTYGPSESESDVAPRIRADLEASLRRLGTDYVDIYLLHVWGLSLDRAMECVPVLEALASEGKIRTYGWSTDRADAIGAFASSPRCGVVEQQLSVMDRKSEVLDLCGALGLGSLDRGPLAMGVLTGKYGADARFGEDDFRRNASWHPAFRNGSPSPEWLAALDSIRQILTSGGRTLAQGALAGIWAMSPLAVPIPGFRTVAQAAENCRAMEFGPLSADELADLRRILAEAAAGSS